MNKLWLDVDGVLLDWVRPFLEYIESPIQYDDLQQYDLSPLFNGDVEKMVYTINEFNSTATYRYLPPMVTRSSLLELKLKGYDLNIISQVDGEQARNNRMCNLQEEFGDDIFTQIVLTGRHEKKVQILRQLEPYDTIAVVEDNPKFFQEALKEGGFRLAAISHPYNHKELRGINGAFPIYSSTNELVRALIC